MKKILLFICCLCISQIILSQAKCGFDERHKQLLAANPEYAKIIKENELKIADYIAKHPQDIKNSPTIVYTIPVVVHVMHTGGAVGTIYNPSDAAIQGAVNYLNQVYAGTYVGMEPPAGGGGIVNMELQFALAQRTPSCGTTNGIDRVDASSIPNYTANGVNNSATTGCTDLELKNFARWNPADYYNIWVVNKIDGADGTVGQFIAGYAYFAGAPPNLDGTVMLATQTVFGENTLPHEIGHAFNLHHPFNGSTLNTQCPTNADCTTQGDLVCDTDPITNNVNGSGIYDFSCRTGINSCTGTAYTVNTEHNFMSYTNCFTLFTNGQKARTQAAMSLPSRASFITSLGATPCGTVINFNTSAATLTESNTGTTVGCRTYTDYVYQLTIGTGPSATATATLTYSGTGTKGLDYEVTTNGNFATPSNVLTFNAAATTPQNFIVRIYNDANVEPAETAILNFTLNNGGGNATIGTTAPTLTITLNDNDLAPAASNTATANYIGNYTANLASGSFLKGSKNKHKNQFLVTAAELNTAGITGISNLTSMKVRVVTKASTQPYTGLSISLVNTTATNLSTGFINPIFTTVYNANYNSVVGDNSFVFSTPFIWDGTSNVVVNICFENSSASADDIMEGDNPSASTVILATYSDWTSPDATAGCSLPASFISSFRVRLQFGYSVTGTPIETAASSTRQEHLAVGSADYFYSNNNKLMAQVSAINAPLGCVTTTVENAGTVWVPFAGGTRSAKVFAITPITNTTTTGYTLSLYFDNTELDGKTAAALKIAKTTAASIGGATALNTVSVTPIISTLGNNTVFTGDFTGFSRFFLIDAAVLLPITGLNLSISETNNIANLVWTTEQEFNNKGFEIEKSFDGITYSTIGFVQSQGNSSSVKYYSFKDKNLSDIQYYRLKQIDFDLKAATSNTVVLKLPNKTNLDLLSVTNPFNQSISLQFNKPVTQKLAISVYDATGKIIYTSTKESNNTSVVQFNVNNALNSGVYILKINTGPSVFIKKLVKL